MKKQYISPKLETMDLRTMNAMMDEPLFGPASNPNQPFSTPAPKRDPKLW